jgi:AraC-like DNA-binding protein
MKKLPMLTKSFLGVSSFLIIPLIAAGFIFYYNLVKYSENEISKSSINNLQTVKKLNDQLVESITKQTIRLSLDIVLQKVLDIRRYNEITGDPDKMISFMNVTRLLDEMVNMNYRIHSIYVYLDNSDYVITSKQSVIKKSAFADNSWIDEYKAKKDGIGAFWLNSRQAVDESTGGISNNVITCILPMKSFLMIDYDGAIVVNIYEHELYSFMNESNVETNGYVFIINKDGTVVSHSDKNLINKSIIDRPYIRSILDSADLTGYLISDTEAGSQMFSYYKSEFNDWIYIGVMPMDNLFGKTNALIGRILLILLGLILAGLIMSYAFSSRMYNPVKKLMLDIQERKGIDFRAGGDEMAILSRVFDSLSRQEDTLSNELEKNKQKLQDKYITDLLDGNLEKAGLGENRTGVEFTNKYFISVLIAIDRYDTFSDKYSPDQQYYMKMMILKTCEEITEPFFQTRGVLFEKNKIALVINSGDYHPVETRRNLQSCFAALQKAIGKIMNNTISFGIGRCYDDIYSLSTSFSEARDALSNRIMKGSGSITFYDDISEVEYKYFYPYHIETHILNFLKLSSRQELSGAIDELIYDIRNRSGISPDNVVQIFIQLIGNTVKFLVEMNINIGNIFGTDYNIYQKLATKETLDDIRVWLSGFYSGILQYMSDYTDTGKSSAADKVLDYLHQNYRSNIDTTAIAGNTGISYSSVGRIVRNKTGKNVLEYINGLRIEEAKRLLRQTNMNITDIALNVGYNNDQSFSRFFKKFEGVTPGEFRNLRTLNTAAKHSD